MSNGIEIKNLPSATTIKQNDTMTIVQNKQNKQLTLDRFANESDLATLSVLENRCDEVKAKIEVDEYSAEITTSQSISKIGSDDNGANLHENVLDGAYDSCVLKGKTKYIDNDTQEILDTFQDGRNLSLIDVKSPILTNLDANNEQSNTVTFDQKDDKTIVLRSLPNGVCDTLNVETGEYVQRIGEVVLDGSSDENWNNTSYVENIETLTQFGIGTDIFNGALPKTANDESVVKNAFIQSMFAVQKATVWTYQGGEACAIHMPEPTHRHQAIQAKVLRSRLSSQDVAGWRALLQATPWILQYELATPIVSTIDVQGFPYAYTNGHIQLSSGSTEPSLTPTVTYKVPVSRVGQIASNTKSNLRQSIKLDQLEVLVYQSLINSEYENLLVQNSAESAASFRNLSVNDPKDGLYYMLKHLIEEDQPVQNMLDKINLFYLYGLLNDEHYFDLLLGGEEDVY